MIVQSLYSLRLRFKAGDDYDTEYGFSAGDTIEKTIIIDKKTQLITSVEEKCGDEFSMVIQ